MCTIAPLHVDMLIVCIPINCCASLPYFVRICWPVCGLIKCSTWCPTSRGSVDLSVVLTIAVHHGPTSRGYVGLSVALSTGVYYDPTSRGSVVLSVFFSTAVYNRPTSGGSVGLSVFLSINVHHCPTSRGSVDLSVFLSNAVHHGPTYRDLLICLCSYQMLCIMALHLVICWSVCVLIKCCASWPYISWSVDLSVFLSNAVHHGPTSRDLLICMCSYQMLCIMALHLVICWSVCVLIKCCTSWPYISWSVDLSVFLSTDVQHGPSLSGSFDLPVFWSIAAHHGPTRGSVRKT